MPAYTRSPNNGNRFTRPLGPNEKYIDLVANLTPSLDRKGWYINSFAKLNPRGSLTTNSLSEILRKAWANLRFQQPSIAAYVTEDRHFLAYDIPGPQDLQQWLQESFVIDAESEDAQAIIKSPRIPKYWACTFVEKSQEVLCYTAHWRSDGIGVLQLFDAFFALAADAALPEPEALPWGEEVSRLALSIEDVAGVPEHANEQQKQFAQKCLETFLLTEGAVGIPCLNNIGANGEAMPGGTLIARTTLSEEATAKVVSRCKQMGISVTSAMHASIAATNWAFATDDRKNQHYTSTARFSFKPYLASPYSGPAYASALLTTGWMVAVSPDKSWEDHARYYNSIYRAGLSQEFIDAYRVTAQGVCDAIADAPKVVSPAAEVDISSIGIAEKYVECEHGSADRGLEVLDIGVAVETLGRSSGLFVWTFRGRLVLNMVFNENFHESKQMEAFTKHVKKDLLERLS
jgi:hypothetical protein